MLGRKALPLAGVSGEEAFWGGVVRWLWAWPQTHTKATASQGERTRRASTRAAGTMGSVRCALSAGAAARGGLGRVLCCAWQCPPGHAGYLLADWEPRQRGHTEGPASPRALSLRQLGHRGTGTVDGHRGRAPWTGTVGRAPWDGHHGRSEGGRPGRLSPVSLPRGAPSGTVCLF